jgi:replicative DNA helicase
VGDYGQAIFDCFLRRELIEIWHRCYFRGHHARILNPRCQRKQIEQTEQKLVQSGQQGRGLGRVHQHSMTRSSRPLPQLRMPPAMAVALTGITSGFRDMNKLLGGLHPSDLIILAARPSMGKTAFATNIAFNAAQSLPAPRQGKRRWACSFLLAGNVGRAAGVAYPLGADRAFLRKRSAKVRSAITDFTKFVHLVARIAAPASAY